MTVTHGHGNPNWTKDEIILALDLYFQCKGKIPGPTDERVVRLSKLLRENPFHHAEVRKESFRNPDGVAFKLQNLRNVATGLGLDNTSRMDRQVWEEFGNNPLEVRKLAKRIIAGFHAIGIDGNFIEEESEEDVFHEGRVITELHRRRERSKGLRKNLILKRKTIGILSCDICGIGTYWKNDIDSDGMFECHHVVPLAEGELKATKIEDVALLCANCHRMIHRFIVSSKKWITISTVKEYLETEQRKRITTSG